MFGCALNPTPPPSMQVAHMFGCALGLSDLMTGMSIVALGTSLPDTFASQYAAIHDDTAVSACIGGGGGGGSR